jgi:LysR family transcriptional regulator, nitrogen assimilation regulatory protein
MVIESIPAMLDRVQQGGVHAVPAPGTVRSSPFEPRLQTRPIGRPPRVTTLWIAPSAQRPRGPLIEPSMPLVQNLLVRLWT